MICKECKEQGLKSTVTSMGSGSTLLGWNPFYDEEGVFHSHNPNRITDYYKCSNRHHFSVVGKAPCPNCDYGKE